MAKEGKNQMIAQYMANLPEKFINEIEVLKELIGDREFSNEELNSLRDIVDAPEVERESMQNAFIGDLGGKAGLSEEQVQEFLKANSAQPQSAQQQAPAPEALATSAPAASTIQGQKRKAPPKKNIEVLLNDTMKTLESAGVSQEQINQFRQEIDDKRRQIKVEQDPEVSQKKRNDLGKSLERIKKAGVLPSSPPRKDVDLAAQATQIGAELQAKQAKRASHPQAGVQEQRRPSLKQGGPSGGIGA